MTVSRVQKPQCFRLWASCKQQMLSRAVARGWAAEGLVCHSKVSSSLGEEARKGSGLGCGIGTLIYGENWRGRVVLFLNLEKKALGGEKGGGGIIVAKDSNRTISQEWAEHRTCEQNSLGILTVMSFA